MDLHLTNGAATVAGLNATGLSGERLSWDDVLHEGPVPAIESFERLAGIRAGFIAAQGWGRFQDVLSKLGERDRYLAGAAQYSEIVLWFEHDMYDQLQLIQILDRLSRMNLAGSRLSLICIDHFPGIDRFTGLGQLTPAQLAELYPTRHQVSQTELRLAHQAWQAFTSPDPTEIERVLARSTTALPFLAGTFQRHLREFPSTRDGLSWTERQILEAVDHGNSQPIDIYSYQHEREVAPFMGGTILWSYIARLSHSRSPLLRRRDGLPFLPWSEDIPGDAFLQQDIELTETGERVLLGEVDWITLNGIDRWRGGVHLLSSGTTWRWDELSGRLVKHS